MAEFTLYLGNKNYSSWSLRGWLAMKQTGAPFQEVVFNLGEQREAIRRLSPSGKVPVLRHGELLVWDSLAIAAYLAESFQQAGLWPEPRDARAVARSAVAEMHSGFPDLRRNMPMNVRRSSTGAGRAPGVDADVARITDLWRDLRARFGEGGPYLFGRFSLADSFYAPVVSRFRTYAVDLDDVCTAYARAVWEHPFLQEWKSAAEAESIVEPQYDL